MPPAALSEPIGIVLVVACLALLTEAVRARPATSGAGSGGGALAGLAGLAGLVAALACLTRYASVVLFPVGLVVLLTRPGRWRARIRPAAAFLAAGLLPFGAWLARNVAAAGNATGDGRGASALTLLTSLKLTLAAVGAWVLPHSAPLVARAVVGGVSGAAVAGVVVAAAGARPRPPPSPPVPAPGPRPAAARR